MILLTYSLGCALGNLLAAFLNYVLPNWRVTIVVVNIPALVSLFMLRYFRESASFYLDNHRYKEAFQHIDLAIKENNPSAMGLSEGE